MAFSKELPAADWARVVGAPMLAGMAVTAADPGGLWGAVKESVGTASALRSGKTGDGGLIDQIVAAYETAEGRDLARGVLKEHLKGKQPSEMVDAALAELKAVADLVAGSAPEAAEPFRRWLLDIAQKVAEAGTEGGFLGFGGVKVSEAEKATLARLGEALA